MIKGKVEEAVSYFEKGFVCSQAVLTPYAETLGLESEKALLPRWRMRLGPVWVAWLKPAVLSPVPLW